jgi:hypothetical protein
MSDKDDLLALLAKAVESGDAEVKAVHVGELPDKYKRDRTQKLDKPTQARVLKDMLPEVHRVCPFQVGDLVEQSQYGAYRFPREGQLAIVSGLNPGIARRRRDDGPVDREDMTILCDVEGSWVEFSVESWRFKAYDGPVE